MELDDDTMGRLMDAGASALDFNSPLGVVRVEAMVARLGMTSGTVVDLGCGRAALLARFLDAFPDRAAIGVDNDQPVIERLRTDPTKPAGLTLVSGDAATWEPPAGDVGAVLVVGVSHAFGGPASMLERMRDVFPRTVVVVGDSVWQSEPDAWCKETFGELPRGVEGLAAIARGAGWVVSNPDMSSPEEWDEFEGGWIQGVRDVGSSEALVFADARAAERERYQGVLGFAWLELTR